MAAVAPKVNGGGAAVEAAVDDAAAPPPPPNVNGLGGCGAEEPNVVCVAEPNTDCVVGAGNADFPKLKADGAALAAVAAAVLAALNPPKDAPVVVWPGGPWPNANTFWFAARGSGCGAPNAKVLVAAAGPGADAAAVAAATVVVAVVDPNWKVLPALGASTGTELVLAVAGVVQFPKIDFIAGGLAFCAVATELAEAVPAGVAVMLENMDGATVVLLMEPNTEDVMLEDSVEAGLPAGMGGA